MVVCAAGEAIKTGCGVGAGGTVGGGEANSEAVGGARKDAAAGAGTAGAPVSRCKCGVSGAGRSRRSAPARDAAAGCSASGEEGVTDAAAAGSWNARAATSGKETSNSGWRWDAARGGDANVAPADEEGEGCARDTAAAGRVRTGAPASKLSAGSNGLGEVWESKPATLTAAGWSASGEDGVTDAAAAGSASGGAAKPGSDAANCGCRWAAGRGGGASVTVVENDGDGCAREEGAGGKVRAGAHASSCNSGASTPGRLPESAPASDAAAGASAGAGPGVAETGAARSSRAGAATSGSADPNCGCREDVGSGGATVVAAAVAVPDGKVSGVAIAPARPRAAGACRASPGSPASADAGRANGTDSSARSADGEPAPGSGSVAGRQADVGMQGETGATDSN